MGIWFLIPNMQDPTLPHESFCDPTSSEIQSSKGKLVRFIIPNSTSVHIRDGQSGGVGEGRRKQTGRCTSRGYVT